MKTAFFLQIDNHIVSEILEEIKEFFSLNLVKAKFESSKNGFIFKCEDEINLNKGDKIKFDRFYQIKDKAYSIEEGGVYLYDIKILDL